MENSRGFNNFEIESLNLEFVEPDDDNQIVSLDYSPSNEEQEDLIKLINAVYDHIVNLNFPDCDEYDATISGTKKFVADLLSGKI